MKEVGTSMALRNFTQELKDYQMNICSDMGQRID